MRTSVDSVLAAIKPAKNTTNAPTHAVLINLFVTVASVIQHKNAVKIPTYTLMIAPLSNPSITDMPTARPARMALIQYCRIESVTSAATARKIMAMVMFHVPNPQQALEKQCMFRPAASAPRTHTIGENFNCRNRTQALNPNSIIVSGVKIARYNSGEMIVARIVASVGEDAGTSMPIHQ